MDGADLGARVRTFMQRFSEAKSTILAIFGLAFLALPRRDYGGAPLKKGVSNTKTVLWPGACVFPSMSLVGPISSSSSNAVRAAAKRARGRKNSKPPVACARACPSTRIATRRFRTIRPRKPLLHSGTVSDVPIRNEQSDFNFTPTFITQLLGQLLPNPEGKHSGALAAYKELYGRIRIFDRLLLRRGIRPSAEAKKSRAWAVRHPAWSCRRE